MTTGEVVILILMFAFGIAVPLWAGHMLKNSPEPSPEPNAEAAAKAFDEAKNKVASVLVKVESPGDKALEEKPVALPETAEEVK